MNIKSFSRKVYIALAACFVMLAVAPMTASAQSQEDQIKATTLINQGDKAPDFTVEMVSGEYKLGFVPRKVNQQLCQFLELGYGDIFDARVQRVSPERHMEDQVGVVIYIKERGAIG